MEIVEKKPVPIYESTCQECKSVLRYKACEVSMLHITCPVCGSSVWANTISPVNFREIYEAKEETTIEMECDKYPKISCEHSVCGEWLTASNEYIELWLENGQGSRT